METTRTRSVAITEAGVHDRVVDRAEAVAQAGGEEEAVIGGELLLTKQDLLRAESLRREIALVPDTGNAPVDLELEDADPPLAPDPVEQPDRIEELKYYGLHRHFTGARVGHAGSGKVSPREHLLQRPTSGGREERAAGPRLAVDLQADLGNGGAAAAGDRARAQRQLDTAGDARLRECRPDLRVQHFIGPVVILIQPGERRGAIPRE